MDGGRREDRREGFLYLVLFRYFGIRKFLSCYFFSCERSFCVIVW